MSLSRLPDNRQLFITTPSAIYLESRLERKPLFECATADGILNARPAKDNSSLLAVADSHVVILYDAVRGSDRKYKLKSGDGEPRMLLFTPSSRILYFTTTLSHSIQAYSVTTAELLPPVQTHPSPPNVLAISKSGDILLSASPAPPTIYIRDLRSPGNMPLHFVPTHAKSSIACAAFQDDTDVFTTPFCLFVLGFQDGTLTLYRLAIPSLPHTSSSPSAHQPLAMQFRQPVKVGSIKKLHKPAMGGICAAEFIPGYKARIVSIGHDGKCRIVDFEHGGEVLRTWRLSSVPTCLSVIATDPVHTRGRKEKDVLMTGDAAKDGEPVYKGVEVLIAIGTQPGKVLIFNVLGLAVHELAIDAPIVALEWVGGMTGPALLPNRRASSLSPIVEEVSQTSQPVTAMMMSEYEQASGGDEDSGTVKKTESPRKRSGILSPLAIRPAKDLFSSSPYRRTSSRFSTHLSPNPSEIVYGSPENNAKRRRRYPRPRIMTETFKEPGLPVTPSLPTSPRRSSSPVTFAISDARRWSQTRTAPDPPYMSGALGVEPHDSHIADEEVEDQVNVDVGESDIFVTPPTSRISRSSTAIANATRPASSGVKSPTRRVWFRETTPPESVTARSELASRHVSFASRSSPKAVDGEMGSPPSPQAPVTPPKISSRESSSRRPSWMHRSPYPSPPGQRPKKTPTAEDRVHRMRKYMGTGEDEESAAPKEGDALIQDNQRLRGEMEALREEFRLLREAMQASRT